jgi:hypothetical protein
MKPQLFIRNQSIPVPISPLQVIEPMNIIVFFSFFSPIIIATSVTSMSFVFQNFKGLIYLGFLIGCCIIRTYVYMITEGKSIIDDSGLCSSIQYTKYGNPTFSTFVFAFTIVYLSFPMFYYGVPNFWVFFSLILYFFTDTFIKIFKGCITPKADLLLNILLGCSSAALIVTLMSLGGSGKYLFFNEVSSNKDICYQPKKQSFRCFVYKNGELLGNA